MNKNKNFYTQKYNTRNLSKDNKSHKVLTVSNGKVIGYEVINNNTIDNNIRRECNKPLKSKSWVSIKNLSSPFPKYHDTQRNKYYLRHFGNTWYEVPKTIKPKKQIEKDVVKERNKKVREVTKKCVVTRYDMNNINDSIARNRHRDIIRMAIS